jgi:hypothetical protein
MARTTHPTKTATRMGRGQQTQLPKTGYRRHDFSKLKFSGKHCDAALRQYMIDRQAARSYLDASETNELIIQFKADIVKANNKFLSSIGAMCTSVNDFKMATAYTEEATTEELKRLTAMLEALEACKKAAGIKAITAAETASAAAAAAAADADMPSATAADDAAAETSPADAAAAGSAE